MQSTTDPAKGRRIALNEPDASGTVWMDDPTEDPREDVWAGEPTADGTVYRYTLAARLADALDELEEDADPDHPFNRIFFGAIRAAVEPIIARARAEGLLTEEEYLAKYPPAGR